jgi:outer membrane receptor for ferrienterochelin and colicins
MVTFKIKTLLTLVFSVFITVLQAQKNGFKLYDAKTLETLAFAHITFKPLKSSKIFNIISDEYGSVELPLGISGEVAVSISYIGYISLIKTINLDRISSLYLFPVIEDIGDVVVTANTGSATTQESIYNIDVIDKEEIENKSANTLADLLSSNEKIEIQYDVLGANISMQGLSGANIKVMIDGVPVIGRLNGEIDLSKINLNNIERVEIVEGPLSVIYGSNALAGVINLISKKTQKDKLNTEINTFYQSIGNYNIDASVSLKIKRHLISLSGGRYFFKGWDEVEVIRDFSWDPKETYFSELSYSYRSKKDWFHRIKASYFQDRLLDRKDPFGPFAKADDVWYKTRKLDFSYNLNGSFKENYYLKSMLIIIIKELKTH